MDIGNAVPVTSKCLNLFVAEAYSTTMPNVLLIKAKAQKKKNVGYAIASQVGVH